LLWRIFVISNCRKTTQASRTIEFLSWRAARQEIEEKRRIRRMPNPAIALMQRRKQAPFDGMD
jgi:hypothetical protein